jgi:hypothetical protein
MSAGRRPSRATGTPKRRSIDSKTPRSPALDASKRSSVLGGTTRLRNMLTYEFTTADSRFDEAALTASREATERIRLAIEAIVATAGGGGDGA